MVVLALTKWVLQVDNMSFSKIRSTQKANLLIEQRYLKEQSSSNVDEDFLNWVKTQEIGVYFYPNPFDKNANEIGLGIIVKGEEPPSGKYNTYYRYLTNSIKGFQFKTIDGKDIYSTLVKNSQQNAFFSHDIWFNNQVESKETSEGLAIYRIFERGSDMFNALENLKSATMVIIYGEIAEKPLFKGNFSFYPFKFTITAKVKIQ